jgi:hypothetical protein
VGIRQGEAKSVVIEFAVSPLRNGVARRASGSRGRKACGNVVRHSAAKRRRAVPGRLVAPVAIRVCGSKGVVVAHVAIGAGHDFASGRQLVRAHQRPAGCGVIKHNVRPQRRIVAGGAIGRRKRRSRR